MCQNLPMSFCAVTATEVTLDCLASEPWSLPSGSLSGPGPTRTEPKEHPSKVFLRSKAQACPSPGV